MTGMLNRVMICIVLGAVVTLDVSARDFNDFERRVLGAYLAYYGRPADPGGLEYWSGRLQSAGGDLSGIINAFGVSEEFAGRFGHLSNSQLIDNLYRQILGRSPDSGGKAYWLGELDSGARSLQEISIAILDGVQGDDVAIVANRIAFAEAYVAATEGGEIPALGDAVLAAYISLIGAQSTSLDNAVSRLVSQDLDRDGTLDSQDAFPGDPAETADSDGDGVGDNNDAFPNDASETVDTDGDGQGDNADNDDDGDGIADTEDSHPLDPTLPGTGSGGGSSGGSSGWQRGVFLPSGQFKNLCENPRSGRDSRGRLFPDATGTTLDENNWLRSWSNELYLWYDELPDLDPGRYDTDVYFHLLRTTATLDNRSKDRFHFTYPTDEWIAQSEGGVIGGYGMTFTISGLNEVIIAYTEPGTPADSAGVARGMQILSIDGIDITPTLSPQDADSLNAALFPDTGETHEFEFQRIDRSRFVASMTSTEIETDPVQAVTTIETDSGTVGYILFNDHIVTAEQQLIAAIEQLRSSNISDLVLDLRYNGGGYLALAAEMGYMIAGNQTTGKTFESLQFNDKHTVFDPVTGQRIEPIPFLDRAVLTTGESLPSLNLDRLFVITSGGTCSASESIINSLRGIDIEVIQIGSTTCGKPYGFYPTDNCGTTYFTIQFRNVNAKGFGDYAAGFTPTEVPSSSGAAVAGCSVSDDLTRQLGDPQEGMLATALSYRESGSCTVSGASTSVFASHPLSAFEGVVAKPETRTIRIYENAR